MTPSHAPEVYISDLSLKLKIFRDPEIHPTAHDKLVEMLVDVGIDLEASCLAATPADIQWMVRAGYGVALVDQRTIPDAGLTTRPIAGIHWTADTTFVHHKKADHLALPFLIRFLQRTPANTPVKRAITVLLGHEFTLGLTSEVYGTNSISGPAPTPMD
jgi:hypothetical protein